MKTTTRRDGNQRFVDVQNALITGPKGAKVRPVNKGYHEQKAG